MKGKLSLSLKSFGFFFITSSILGFFHTSTSFATSMSPEAWAKALDRQIVEYRIRSVAPAPLKCSAGRDPVGPGALIGVPHFEPYIECVIHQDGVEIGDISLNNGECKNPLLLLNARLKKYEQAHPMPSDIFAKILEVQKRKTQFSTDSWIGKYKKDDRVKVYHECVPLKKFTISVNARKIQFIK